MKRTENKTHIESLLVLVLFGIFATCILVVLFTGADAYERLVQNKQEAYEERTIPQYIATKVRQADEAGAVSLGELGGVPALELRELLGNEEYITRIYCYDGYLRELFTASSGMFRPEDGECIMETEQVEFSMEGNHLKIMVTGTDGEAIKLQLTLRSTKGGSLE